MEHENNPITVQNIQSALECPINLTGILVGESTKSKVYELWYAYLKKYLPDASYADLLLGDFNEPQYTPDKEDIFELHIDDVALEGVASDVIKCRADKSKKLPPSIETAKSYYPDAERHASSTSLCGVWIDVEFEKSAGWIRNFNVASKDIRSKHWPSSSNLNTEDFLKESKLKKDEGLLLPSITTENLKLSCLDGLMRIIDNALMDESIGLIPKFRHEEFLKAWLDLVDKGPFRFSIWHETPIGAYNGELARWLICDIDPVGAIAHCYPALKPLGLPYDLQDEGIGELPEVSGRYFGTM